jgi:cysteine desulfurase
VEVVSFHFPAKSLNYPNCYTMKVYFDNAASTPLDKTVYNAMAPYLLEQYGIPSSHHGYGRDAKAAIELSRANIAKLLHVQADEIIFTCGGTESNFLAISSAVNCAFIDHVITTPFEHEAVLDTLRTMQRTRDVRVSYIRHDDRGNLDLTHLEYLLRTNTRNLVSVMHANNEIGNLNDIETIGLLCEKYKAPFHTDAAQSIGHHHYDLKKLKIDFLSASAHKFHGPKGVGFLYFRNGNRQFASVHGRVTDNIPGIIGMSKALEVSYNDINFYKHQIQELKNRMISQLSALVPDISFNGNSAIEGLSVPSILSVSIPPLQRHRSLHQFLDNHNIAVSGGSSLNAHVLKALGVDHSFDNVRFSFSRLNTIAEIDHVIGIIGSIYETVAA